MFSNAFYTRSAARFNTKHTAKHLPVYMDIGSFTDEPIFDKSKGIDMSNNRGRRSSVVPPKDQTRLRIERMEAEREERRRAMMERKKERAEEEQRNIAAGNPGDVDFIGLVRAWRKSHASAEQPHESNSHPRICICVRKRPISDKEREKNDHDSVTCLNPAVWIHSAKFKVDGITKYLDHTSFRFDHAFGEHVSTEEVYQYTTMPLVDFCVESGGRATVFAYGQTGSGKTYTMNGIQSLLCEDLFLLLENDASNDTIVMISFFELYGGYVQDLLNDRKRLKVLEDGKGEVVVTGLQELQADSPKRFLQILDEGNEARTTRTTEANDTSSRSHAICQIILRDRHSDKLRGKLSLVDLAGSERGTDTKSHDSQRRTESADINTSLLALKECIRALDKKKGAKHVPYRASKLTLILKDCFTSDCAMTTMIATVSPGASAADHSLNTLRYADRIKEKRVSGQNTVVSRQSRSKKAAPVANKYRSTSPKPSQPAVSRESSSFDDNDSQARELFEREEDVLNTHMGFISENAKLLSQEGVMLQEIQKENVSDRDLDRYAAALEDILDRKEDMILALQSQLKQLRQG